MSKRQRRLTRAEKLAREEPREEFEWIFVNGKQKRVRRPPTVEGVDVDEFIRLNADPIALHQEGMWELMQPDEHAFGPWSSQHSSDAAEVRLEDVRSRATGGAVTPESTR